MHIRCVSDSKAEKIIRNYKLRRLIHTTPRIGVHRQLSRSTRVRENNTVRLYKLLGLLGAYPILLERTYEFHDEALKTEEGIRCLV